MLLRLLRNTVAVLLLSCPAFAATNITTPSVAGHWTISGSPYHVYNDIRVDSSASLIIDAGVEVLFHGTYRFLVYGSLQANGTAAQQIKLHPADTTGFMTDNLHATGGWHGIQFPAYGGTGTDSSVLDNCEITFTKFDSVDQYGYPWLNTLFIGRSMAIKNCNIYNNMVPKYVNYGLFFLYCSSDNVFEMSGCNIYENYSPSGLFWMNGGNNYLHDNNIHNNHSGLSLIRADFSNFLFEHNDFHDNLSLRPESACAGLLIITDLFTSIRNNRIYNNESEMEAAVSCGGGHTDIIGNFIANNHHRNGLCGWTDGGGGVQLSTNWTGIDPDSTIFNLRNNIFANNYSPLYGAAINVINARTNIVNNHFINNTSATGSAVYINNFTTSYNALVKNNLFFGNIDEGQTAATSTDVRVYNGGNVVYENNWSTHPTYLAFGTPSMGFTLAGDTLSNVTGTDPLMINPTLTAEYTESALTADFRLKPGSGCINNGSTTGVTVDTTDYAGHPRVNGTIDIGAYEYLDNTGVMVGNSNQSAISVYPNPASNLAFIATPAASGMLTLIDATGKTIMEQTVCNRLTPVQLHYAAGTYFARWTNGAEHAMVKFVVE